MAKMLICGSYYVFRDHHTLSHMLTLLSHLLPQYGGRTLDLLSTDAQEFSQLRCEMTTLMWQEGSSSVFGDKVRTGWWMGKTEIL